MTTPLDALRQFAREAGQHLCTGPKAFAQELHNGFVDRSGGVFRSGRAKYDNGTVIMQCEWTRLDGTWADLQRDFYTAYAEWIYEDSQFIQCVTHEKVVCFSVVAGSGADVHSWRLRIVGEHVERLLAPPATSTKQRRGRRR